jgi:hypothetical protein
MDIFFATSGALKHFGRHSSEKYFCLGSLVIVCDEIFVALEAA